MDILLYTSTTKKINLNHLFLIFALFINDVKEIYITYISDCESNDANNIHQEMILSLNQFS